MYNKQDIERAKSFILEVVDAEQIILFGSYATGKYSEDRDIDLMILVTKEMSRKEKLNILFEIEKRILYTNLNVDIVLKNLESFENYKNYIRTINYDVSREGKILWTKT